MCTCCGWSTTSHGRGKPSECRVDDAGSQPEADDYNSFPIHDDDDDMEAGAASPIDPPQQQMQTVRVAEKRNAVVRKQANTQNAAEGQKKRRAK
jgi:hypothetical protein